MATKTPKKKKPRRSGPGFTPEQRERAHAAHLARCDPANYPKAQPAPPDDPGEYVPDTYLMKRYNVSRPTIWRWTKIGILPQPVKFGYSVAHWRLSARP